MINPRIFARGAIMITLPVCADCVNVSTPDTEDNSMASSSSESASGPSTSNPSTSSPSTSSPSTSSPSTSTTQAETGDLDGSSGEASSSGTGNPTCWDASSFTITWNESEDPNGHTPYLMLFYDVDSETHVDEQAAVELDGYTVTFFSIEPREPGSGHGHGGIAELSGTIDADCYVDIDGQVPFTSDGGSFGDVDVTITGTLAEGGELALTMGGGNIPSGPITYVFTPSSR